MMTMLDVEVRRCLSRRLVRGLIAVALVGCALTALIAQRVAEPAGSPQEFRLEHLWLPDGDAFLAVGAIFLVIGAAVGGASMVGAEWRAGTFTTLLTWVPDRTRVAVSKLLACGIVAFVVGVALQIVFCAAFLPAALGPGTTEGVDGAWLWTLAGAAVRIATLTGLAAMLMAAIAMLGRNTAAAMGTAFAYLMVVENIVHGWKPWAGRFLIGPNGAIFVTGGELETESWSRSTVTAGLTLVGYFTLVAAAAVVSFRRRDLASAV
jgi:hypothetical protein